MQGILDNGKQPQQYRIGRNLLQRCLFLSRDGEGLHRPCIQAPDRLGNEVDIKSLRQPWENIS